MSEKNKFKVRRFLIIIAILSLLISIAEGAIYYSSYENRFFKVLMILQNCINAFALKPSITIKDVKESFVQTDAMWVHAVGYAYCIAIFLAYYCTLAAIYKLLERALKFALVFRCNMGREHILIFGYNGDVKILLDNGLNGIRAERKKYAVHIISPEEINAEECYKYLKKGYRFHQFDCFKSSNAELKYLLKYAYIDKASALILLDESSMRNFSLLQMFYGGDTDTAKTRKNVRLSEHAKVFCRCEDEGARHMIADFYDHRIGEGRMFDLELISLAEMQVRRMFEKYPIHNYYLSKQIDVKHWDVDLLILGFGEVGQQVLEQTLNMGVVSSENAINVNVVDFNVKEKAEIFANHFSLDSFELDEGHFYLKEHVADGVLDICFHSMDVRYKQFRKFLEKKDRLPTYVVIAIDDLDVAVHCVMELKQYLSDHGESNVPIILRMEQDRRLADYISENNGRSAFKDVFVMEDKQRFLSFDFILNEDVDSKAKAFNLKYSLFRFAEDGGGKADFSTTESEAWKRLKLFKRDSSRELAYHEKVKALLYERYEADEPGKLGKKLEEILGSSGTLLVYEDEVWHYKGSEKDFLKDLEADEFAYEFAKMEHRRWCYFMVSRGWRPDKSGKNQKSEESLVNPCLVTEEELIEHLPYMVKYDLMPLLAEYTVGKAV